jgi:predicted metal-dependent hydrolase
MKTAKTSKSRNLDPQLLITRHDYDPLYLAYFAHFNAQRFFEAHEVLEELWRETAKPKMNAEPTTTHWQFYKGLIQLAVVFVHLRKNNLPGASALLRRAQENLAPYAATGVGTRVLSQINNSRKAAGDCGHYTPQIHEGLDVTPLLAMIEQWRTAVKTAQASGGQNPFSPNPALKLVLKGVEI